MLSSSGNTAVLRGHVLLSPGTSQDGFSLCFNHDGTGFPVGIWRNGRLFCLGSSETERDLFFARPHSLSAARVRENWFSGSSSMTVIFTEQGRDVNSQFLQIGRAHV